MSWSPGLTMPSTGSECQLSPWCPQAAHSSCGESGAELTSGSGAPALLPQSPLSLAPHPSTTQSHLSYAQGVVPGSRAERGAVGGHPQGTDAVLVSEQDGDPGALQHIPDVDGVVVVSGKQQAAWPRDQMIVIKPLPSLFLS